MSNNNELYDHLSAARIVYLDMYDNELDIIRELKIYLIESGFSTINNQLYNFYQYINTPIELNTISNVSITSDLNNIVQLIFNSNNIINNINNINNNTINDNSDININDNNINNNNNNDSDINDNDTINDDIYDDIDDDDNQENINQSRFIITHNSNIIINSNNIINIFTTLINNSNMNLNQENVVVTIDDKDFDELSTELLTCDHDSNCSICMSQMIKDEKITLLKCKHNFHYDCITPYLKEYNYKCPVCRAEVGKAKYNI